MLSECKNNLFIYSILSYSRAFEVGSIFFNWYIDCNFVWSGGVEFSKNDLGGTHAYKSDPHCSCSLRNCLIKLPSVSVIKLMV